MSEEAGASRWRTLGKALEAVHSALDEADLYFGHGTDSAWDEAVALVLTACDLDISSGEEVLDLPLTAAQAERIARWCEERIARRRPLPYITGRGWFAGLEFSCDERALVPRSPLGEVIGNAFAPWWQGRPPVTLLDLCCGGGAIGIAAAVRLPDLAVTLADLSPEALELARINTARHAVAERVEALCSDLFSALAGRRYDIILCNPPYVNAEDLAEMPAEYHREPSMGLGSGADGLDHARRILCAASEHLTGNGLLFLELGNSWATLDAILAELPLTWLDFSEGGHGVLLLRRDELDAVAGKLGAGPRV
ncbi:MAG: 50S ribosomal protein L3 N(5)-glutamine methyltransferase [Halieaceae bacterium]|nr:50S ribosomal protein L3 N(5)-glutamine methyltransferase [Halieaceae bacterium]